MKLAVAALATSMLIPSPAHAANTHQPDLNAVLSRPRQRLQTADYRATGRIVRVSPEGARTNYPLTLKAHGFPGVLRILCEISSPAGAREHILLEMHPDGQDSIRIVHPGDKAPATLPFEKWTDSPLGSGFSYEDFLEAHYFWPDQKLLESKKYGARDCDVLRSMPGPTTRTHYAEIRTWLDRDIGYPVYVEKSPKGTAAVKEFTSFGLRRNGVVWSASQVEVKLHGRPGSTLLIIERGSTKANFNLGDFSSERLTRF